MTGLSLCPFCQNNFYMPGGTCEGCGAHPCACSYEGSKVDLKEEDCLNCGKTLRPHVLDKFVHELNKSEQDSESY